MLQIYCAYILHSDCVVFTSIVLIKYISKTIWYMSWYIGTCSCQTNCLDYCIYYYMLHLFFVFIIFAYQEDYLQGLYESMKVLAGVIQWPKLDNGTVIGINIGNLGIVSWNCTCFMFNNMRNMKKSRSIERLYVEHRGPSTVQWSARVFSFSPTNCELQLPRLAKAILGIRALCTQV